MSATLDEKDLAKLPKWAQEHVRLLEMRLKEARDELHGHLAVRAPSEVAIDRTLSFGNVDEPREASLPEHSTIVFYLDDDQNENPRLRKRVEVRRAGGDDESYYLSVSSGGGGYPSVQPQAANVLRVRIVERP